MKNTHKIIWFYLKYLMYWFITIEDRNNYMAGKAKGYNCTGSYDDSYIVYGSARVHTYENKPPTRNYITFKQYKKMYYPKI